MIATCDRTRLHIGSQKQVMMEWMSSFTILCSTSWQIRTHTTEDKYLKPTQTSFLSQTTRNTCVWTVLMLSYIKQRFMARYFGYQAVVQPTKKRNNSIAQPKKVVPTSETSSYTVSPVSHETYPQSTTRFEATKNSPQLWLPTGTVVCMSPGGSRTQPKP